jgi:hypothetical protein
MGCRCFDNNGFEGVLFEPNPTEFEPRWCKQRVGGTGYLVVG